LGNLDTGLPIKRTNAKYINEFAEKRFKELQTSKSKTCRN